MTHPGGRGKNGRTGLCCIRRPGLLDVRQCRGQVPQFLSRGAQVLDGCHELPEQPDPQEEVKKQGQCNERYPD